MNNRFVIINDADEQNRRTIDFYQHDSTKAHTRLPIGPHISIVETSRYADVLPEYAPEISHTLLRAEQLIESLDSSAVRLNAEALYEINEDLQGVQFISTFPALEIGGNCYYTYTTSKYVSDLSFQDIQKVKFRTACCLFSDKAARFVQADGQPGPSVVIAVTDMPEAPFSEIQIDDELTIYEYETVMRLGTMISDLAHSLRPSVEIEVTLDVPRVQYYLYLVDLFNQGVVSSQLMLKWFEAVDRRSAAVKDLFKKRIRSRIVSGRNVRFIEAAGLDTIETYIRGEVVKDTKNITLEKCIAALLAKPDPILELLVERRKIQTIRDLSHLSYIAEMLYTGLGDSPHEIGIDVVNHIERRVFSYVSKFAPKVRRMRPDKTFALICLYPRERIFTTDNAWRPSLYRYDPGRFVVDNAHNNLDLFKIVDQFYE